MSEGSVNSSILAVITARAGSKGIPGKNMMNLRGVPLAVWSLLMAQDTPGISQTCVSTDIPELLELVRTEYHEDVLPIVRPPELATDEAASVDVVLHALSFAEAELEKTFDHVLLIEPSSPLRRRRLLSDLIQLHLGSANWSDAAVVCAEMMQIPEHALVASEGRLQRPSWSLGEHSGRRQDYMQYLYPTGQGYIASAEALQSQRTFYPIRSTFLLEKPMRSFELDRTSDLQIVEFLAGSKEYDWIVESWRNAQGQTND